MKLTKYHKETFVEGVMRDIPKTDYSDRVAKIVHDDMEKQASPALKRALADREIRPMLLSSETYYVESIHVDNRFYGRYDVGMSSVPIHKGYSATDDAKARIAELMTLAVTQHIERKALREKVTSAIGACSTLKVALERMPEFAKYMPEEASPTSFLPAIANLAADLINAGWKVPKTAAV